MFEYDWLLSARIYGLVGCLKSKLSDYKQVQLQTGQIRQLSSQ